MIPTDDFQDRSIRLKRLIAQSKNVKPEIKKIFGEVDESHFETKGFSKNKAEIFSLYQFRYRFLTEKGIHSEAWTNVLNLLAEVDDTADVYLTVVTITGEAYIIFSDNDYEKCFGMIFKDW